MERNNTTHLRLVWPLLGAATVLLLVAAIAFADGATAVAASVPRLLLAIASLTLGGTLAVLAVLEAWQPGSAPINRRPRTHASSAGSPAGPT